MSETDYAVAPGEYLVEWLEDHGSEGADLYTNAQALKTALGWNGVQAATFLTGDIHLTPERAAQLETLTSISAETWLRYERQYRADTQRLRNPHAGDETGLAIAMAMNGSGYRGHIFEAERCIFCGVNYLDDMMYGDEDEGLAVEEKQYNCIDRGRYSYSTVTPPPATH